MANPTTRHEQPAPGTLLNALHRYNAGVGDLAELQIAMESYKMEMEKAAHPTIPRPSWRDNIASAMASFTIFPKREYEFFAPLLLEQTSAEAIASHWRAVGEHLSYAFISHILEENHEVNGEKNKK